MFSASVLNCSHTFSTETVTCAAEGEPNLRQYRLSVATRLFSLPFMWSSLGYFEQFSQLRSRPEQSNSDHGTGNAERFHDLSRVFVVQMPQYYDFRRHVRQLTDSGPQSLIHLFVKKWRWRSFNLYVLRLHRMERWVSAPGFQDIERSIDCSSVEIASWILMKLGWQSLPQEF